MTYDQALALLRQRYGTQPWTQASGSEVQSYLRSQGVPSSYITQIGVAYYTAQRTNTTIDNVLQTKGIYTPTTTTATTTTSAPAPTPTATTTGTTVPVLAAPSFTGTPTTTTTAPVVTSIAPSTLASQESGAIGAASIASQMNAGTTTSSLPTVINQTSTTVNTPGGLPSTIIADGVSLTYDPVSGNYKSADGRNTLYTDEFLPKLQTGEWSFTNGVLSTTPSSTYTLGTATTTPVYDPAFTRAALAKLTGGQVLTNDEMMALGIRPPVTAPVTTTAPASTPTLTNPLATTTTAQAPTVAGGGTLQNPLAGTTPTTTTTPVAPAMGGTPEDQTNYRAAIERLTAQLALSKENAGLQAADTRAQYESQIRKAGRDLYNAQVKSLASLAARGISGAPGLSVAARRAGSAEPDYRREGLIADRERQLSALNRTLSQQLLDYESELRRNQQQLTRATTLANQLTGTTGTTGTGQ